MSERRLRQPRGRSFYERALLAADRDALAEAREVEGLDQEVALLRMELRRLLTEEPVDYAVVEMLMRLLTQALATRHRISPYQVDSLSEAIARLLEEFGALLAPPEEAARA